MKRRGLRVAAGALLGLLLVGTGLVFWLGPGAAWWSLSAWRTPGGADASWRHVPVRVPVLVAADPRAFLHSPVARAVRPQLAELALLHGMDLQLAEGSLERAVGVFDGSGRGYLVGTGLNLSPLMLPRFDDRWKPSGRGVTDGAVFLAPLAPGVVLASRLDAADESLARSDIAAEGGDGVVRLPLDEPGVALRAEVVPDEPLRRELEARLPSQVSYLAADLARVTADVRAGEDLAFDLTLAHQSRESAERTALLLTQLDQLARMARKAGPLAAVLLQGESKMLLEMPEMTIAQDGPSVHASFHVPPDQLGRWLTTAAERARASLER